jgi:hypothetical protein
MMFTVGVVMLWSIFKTHTTKLPLIPFVVTGYSSVLLWRNTISRCGNAVEPNRSLLHHRNVRVVDLFTARLILETAGRGDIRHDELCAPSAYSADHGVVALALDGDPAHRWLRGCVRDICAEQRQGARVTGAKGLEGLK